MKKLIITMMILFATSTVCADTIYFSNGALVEGNVVSQNDYTVTVDSNGKQTTYSRSDIQNIQPGPKVASPPPPPPMQPSSPPPPPQPSSPQTAPAATPDTYTSQQGQPPSTTSQAAPPVAMRRPRLVGPLGATGVIRRHERREVRRGATIQ